jgi:hypothetical protein
MTVLRLIRGERASGKRALACSLLGLAACMGGAAHEPRLAPPIDVRIHPFDPGPDRAEPPTEFDELLTMLGFKRVALPVSTAVRRAESSYLPHLLAQALADAGSWGALWILPDAGIPADLEVRARIVESDGEQLVLQVEATDASGAPWLRREYEAEMELEGYRAARALPQADPAQPLFAAIARDLARERDRRGARGLHALRRISELRFASAIAPDVFGPYLRWKESALQADPLPPELEPQLARVRELRAYDARIAQALTRQHDEQAHGLAEPYREWRASSLEQITAFRQSMRQAGASVAASAALVAAGAVLGNNIGTDQVGDALRGTFGLAGIYAAKPGVGQISEARARAEALAQRGASFEEATAMPFVVVMDHQMVRFTGTRAEQLEKWQRFLATRFGASSADELFDFYFESAFAPRR